MSDSNRTRTDKILLVDDEEMLVEIGKDMLQELGYNSLGATDSQTALELFKSAPNEFDLVITDNTMPGMTGTELATKMLAIRPDIPVILATGYSISEEEAEKFGLSGFILKPYSMDLLEEKINQAIANRK